jgi:preprotein translocase subunit SecG
MLTAILLTANILVCIALIGVVLLQRSEGGALGMGGGPTGFMTAAGAGDLLTKTTWVLFSLFLTFSLALTLISGRARANSSVVNRMKVESIDPDALRRPAAPDAAPAPIQAPAPQLGGLPAAPAQTPAPAPAQAPQ